LAVSERRWTHGDAFGGIAIDRDGNHFALIAVDYHCAYSTALKKARRMVRLLNAGEAELAREAARIKAMEDEPCPACEDTGIVTSIHCDTIGLRCGCGIGTEKTS
jgi:hypothetical protein